MSAKAECLGSMKLYIDSKEVAKAPFRTQPHRYSMNSGEGLAVGYLGNDKYTDVELEFERKMKTE